MYPPTGACYCRSHELQQYITHGVQTCASRQVWKMSDDGTCGPDIRDQAVLKDDLATSP